MKRVSLTSLFLLVMAGPAQAMHIAEGILPLPWATLWAVVALPFVALGVQRMNAIAREELSFKPLVGLMAAVVFIISCMPIPVPTAGTCSHPCGTAIAAILVGPLVSILISAVALLIQALFLAHGGLSTWGADIVSMGLVGSFAGWAVFRGLRGVGANLAVAGFMAGLLTDWATYLATSVELAAGIRGDAQFLPLLWQIIAAFIPTQLPLGILEGGMTAGMVLLLSRKRPDLLVKLNITGKREQGTGNRERGTGNGGQGVVGKVAALLLVCGLLSSAPLPVVAAEKWPGVDESVVKRIAAEHGRQERRLPGLEGDAQLFAFLVAGALGGFAAGYWWRMLVSERALKKRSTESEKS